jgi:hypothetical protein
MPKGNTLSRIAIASLAAAALAAPAAGAQGLDTHIRTATKSTPMKQDLRGEAAAASKPKPAKQDLRGEAAAGTSPSLGYPGNFPGPPTWPTHPEPIPSAQVPVATGGGSDDGGIELPVALLGIAGALALGGFTVGAVRYRTRVAH